MQCLLPPQYAGSAILRYIIGRGFPTLAVGTWATKQLDLHRMKLMGLVACLVNWVDLIVLSSQAAGLHLKMKLMGLASTICLLIIVAILLPSPATTAPTLFSHLKDTLTKIGGPLGEPSRPRAKLSSPSTSPNPLVPSFGVRRLKWNWTINKIRNAKSFVCKVLNSEKGYSCHWGCQNVLAHWALALWIVDTDTSEMIKKDKEMAVSTFCLPQRNISEPNSSSLSWSAKNLYCHWERRIMHERTSF